MFPTLRKRGCVPLLWQTRSRKGGEKRQEDKEKKLAECMLDGWWWQQNVKWCSEGFSFPHFHISKQRNDCCLGHTAWRLHYCSFPRQREEKLQRRKKNPVPNIFIIFFWMKPKLKQLTSYTTYVISGFNLLLFMFFFFFSCMKYINMVT